MVTLLILTCGTNACFHISKILKEKYRDDFRIVGTDINKLWMIPTAPYLDAFYQCPYTTSSDYYPFVLDICRKEKVNYLLPSFDADQLLFFDGNADLKLMNVRSFGISETIKDIYSNKEKTNQFLSSVNLPTPKYFKYSEVKDGCRYFVKPIHGVGSTGARVIDGRELLYHQDDGLLIQEICSEPEVTLECFLFEGELRSVARVRLGTKSGVCTKTKVYHDEILQTIAEKFAHSTTLPHIFNLQFMRNSERNPVITDVNLRTAGGLSLSYAAGWDEVSALANIMLKKSKGEVLKPVSHYISDQFIIRAYTDIVTKKIKSRIAFDLDGTLLDSRNRHSFVMDKILKTRHIEIDAHDLVEFKSNKRNNIEWLQSKGVPLKDAKDINSDWVNDIEDCDNLVCDTLYDGVIEVLSNLSRNHDLYLLTARNNGGGLNEQLNNLKILQYFSEVIVVPSNSSTPNAKARELCTNDIDIFVGDTESDYEATINAGCKFVASNYGFRSKLFWNNYDVEQIDGINKIIDIVNKDYLNMRTHPHTNKV